MSTLQSARLARDDHRRASRRPAVSRVALICAALAVPLCGAPVLGAQAAPARPAQEAERIDAAAIERIRMEGIERSQVMELASWLTDIYGPRLSGSPNLRAAGAWAVNTLRGWGITDARLEPWGEFGRGWSNERVAIHVVAPQSYPVLGYPLAWTPGTNGPVRGEAVRVDLRTAAELDQVRGTLRGRFVMISPSPESIPPLFEPQARRHTEEQLARMAAAPAPTPPAESPGQPRAAPTPAPITPAERTAFLMSEGVAGILTAGRGRGDHGSVLVGGGGGRAADAAPTPPMIALAAEHYGRIVRTLEKGIGVTLEVDVRNHFHTDDLTMFNVVAELPGSDLRHEIVMLGAHFDSWHAGTGATDNASGSVVMLEAMRILQATGLPLRRTVRMALWTGEEQGLLGSRAYVERHFAERQTMRLRRDHARFSVYFNMDNGTGQFRGIFAQGNERARPIFEQWMAPFREWGVTTVSLANTGGTDHLAFDAVGLPGFQFIQDPIEYGSRTHHSNQDLYDRLLPRDLMRNATIVAAWVYLAANRDELFPRKALPAAPRAAAQEE